MKHYSFHSLCLNIFALVTILTTTAQGEVPVVQTPGIENPTSRIIVKFKDVAEDLDKDLGRAPESIQEINNRFHVLTFTKFLTTNNSKINAELFSNVYLVELPPTTDITQAIQAYSNDIHVVYAQADYIAHTQ